MSVEQFPVPGATEDGGRTPTEIDFFVGQRIRDLRQEAGMKLHALSSLLNISHQQLQKYETGKNRVSAGMLWNIAAALGVRVADLFPDADRVAIPVSPAARQSMTRAAALMREAAARIDHILEAGDAKTD